MQLDYILWLYILIFITILLVLIRNNKEFSHSLFFSLVISFAFLLFAKPPNDIDIEIENISCVFIYFAIVFISVISVFSEILMQKN